MGPHISDYLEEVILLDNSLLSLISKLRSLHLF